MPWPWCRFCVTNMQLSYSVVKSAAQKAYGEKLGPATELKCGTYKPLRSFSHVTHQSWSRSFVPYHQRPLKTCALRLVHVRGTVVVGSAVTSMLHKICTLRVEVAASVYLYVCVPLSVHELVPNWSYSCEIHSSERIG